MHRAPRPHVLPRRVLLLRIVPIAALSIASCTSPPPHSVIDDAEAARLAYLGLDHAVDRVLKLGFDGFNAASSANIPEQSEPGDAAGLMVVNGKVDQGSSANKGMQLEVSLADYSDGLIEGVYDVVYDGGPNSFDLSLKGLPDADLTGSLQGDFLMSGELAGPVELELSFTGQTEEGPDGIIRRKAGTIHVVGTATSDYGVFNVDVSL